MTSANGTPVAHHRRPSAAFPRVARGASPPKPEARAAPGARPAAALPLLAAALLLLGAATVAMAGEPRRLPDAPHELLPPARAERPEAAVPDSPRAACLAAARRAEAVHGLPEGLLVAIALAESGLHAHALSIDGQAHYPQHRAAARRLLLAARGRAVMAGCMQVNAGVHAREGADWPLDAERSADWAGGMLRRWYIETGSWSEAVRRWHGGPSGSTQRLRCRLRARLEVVAPGSALLQGGGCDRAEAARLRRNGEALLEVAEMPDR